MSGTIYIYGLREVGTDLVFYVGTTINIKRRLREHRRVSRMKQLRAWIDSFGDESRIEAVILENLEAGDEATLKIRESAHIAYWLERNPQLCNVRLIPNDITRSAETVSLTCPHCGEAYWNKEK
jgi:hypothetical protein